MNVIVLCASFLDSEFSSELVRTEMRICSDTELINWFFELRSIICVSNHVSIVRDLVYPKINIFYS